MRQRSLLGAALALVLVGCGSGIPSSVVGTYHPPGITTSSSLTLGSDGKCSLTLIGQTGTCTYTVSGQTITVTPTNGAKAGTYTIDTNNCIQVPELAMKFCKDG